MPSTTKEDTSLISKLKTIVSFKTWTFFTIYLSAILFVVSLCTNNWYICGDNLKAGIWSICILEGQTESWNCNSFHTDLGVTVQAFSLMCILGYTCTVIFLVTFVKCSSSTSSVFPLTISFCLLCLCIASLQMMILTVYAIKVKDSIRQTTMINLKVKDTSVSWSFGIGLISLATTTMSGILAFSEIRKITISNGSATT